MIVRESGKEKWWEIKANEMESEQIGEDMNGGAHKKEKRKREHLEEDSE